MWTYFFELDQSAESKNVLKEKCEKVFKGWKVDQIRKQMHIFFTLLKTRKVS